MDLCAVETIWSDNRRMLEAACELSEGITVV